ncbi:MAG TPA: hypothetical protein VKY73_04760, partial [Polyangiaceae bacterium]|nr:hypothetical protein [Polyangiaceae bacterium]
MRSTTSFEGPGAAPGFGASERGSDHHADGEVDAVALDRELPKRRQNAHRGPARIERPPPGTVEKTPRPQRAAGFLLEGS